jgi:hypothetical protein
MTHKKCSPRIIRIGLLFTIALTLAVPAPAEWKEKVLYSFQGGTDGSLPAGGVIFDKAGNLYGLTIYGGSTACPPGWCGTIYELSPPAQKGGAWTEKVVYVFKGHNQNDGSSPSGSLIADSAGNLYGVTGYGGSGPCVLFGTATGCGTAFELSPPKTKGGKWTEKVLYNFQGGKDGDLPTGPLVFDSAGNLYGATEFGGGKGAGLCDPFYQGCGTVFKLSPPTQKGGKWTETALHSFAAGNDGYNPNGGLLLDGKGNVYGAAPMGGNQLCNFGDYKVGCGIVFKLIPPNKIDGAWTEEILHRFTLADGAGPNGNLRFDSHDRIYGTANGGSSQNGVVYRLASGSSAWKEVVLYNFGKGISNPQGGVIFDGGGSLFGTALGGPTYRGVVYRLRRPKFGNQWSFSMLYNFTGPPDGYNPTGDLILNALGSLYTTTSWGGTSTACQGGCGTVSKTWP